MAFVVCVGYGFFVYGIRYFPKMSCMTGRFMNLVSFSSMQPKTLPIT